MCCVLKTTGECMQLFYILVYILSFGISLSCAQQEKQSPAPVLEFANYEVNLGKVGQDSLQNYTFNFTNTGNAVLEIHKVRSS
jgi:hypothetical protein